MLSGVGPHWFFSQRNILGFPVQEVHPVSGQTRISPCPAPVQLSGVGLILGGSPCPWPVVATNTSQPLFSNRKAVPKEAVFCPVPSSWQFWCPPISPCASTWAAVTSWTQRLIPRCVDTQAMQGSWAEMLWRGWGSCWDSCLCAPPLQGCCPPALYCCSAVCSYLLLPQVCINHSSPNLCSCTFAKVISTVHIWRELFLSAEQPASASACTALSACLKMLYRSTLASSKESAEEGKKLMKGCQASHMQPPESHREEGTEQWLQFWGFFSSFFLFVCLFAPAWASLPQCSSYQFQCWCCQLHHSPQ